MHPLQFSRRSAGLLALLLPLVLAGCGAGTPSSSLPEQDPVTPTASAVEKINPGCRVDLPYPLQMAGDSTASSFADDWTATDLDGNTVTQEVLAGSKVTVLTIWSSYCGSCVEDLEALQQVYAAYDREQVNVIGIVASGQNPDGTLKETEPYLVADLQEMSGATFQQLWPSDDLIAIHLKDLDIVPETLLLDSQGRQIGDAIIGPRTAEEFQSAVEEALASLEAAQ